MKTRQKSILILLGIVSFGSLHVRQQSAPIVPPINLPQQEKKFDANNGDTEITADIEAKNKNAIDLVNRAIEYMKNNPIDEAFSAISHSSDFTFGEFYIFVYGMQGVCLAHGQQPELIWENLWDSRDSFGILITQEVIKKAQAGGGWITYNWRNATKVTYVQQVEVEGKLYTVGTGYYPHSKKDSVVNLVKGAVSLFDQAIEKGSSPEEVFAIISYPLGQFVLGSLYLYALDFEGEIVAQGNTPGLIGSSAWESSDEKGIKINQEIIAKLQKNIEGIWIDYISKNAAKRAYAEKVTDKEGKNYFIACGFYPDADRKHAVDLLRKGFKFMKINGLSATTEAITTVYENKLRYGDLYLTVYSVEGECLAHGSNPALVGKNYWDVKDQDGKYYVRNMIKKALIEPGWVDYKIRNLFKSSYVEKIELGTESYVIECGFYPISKRERAILLAKTAADYLIDQSRQVAFHDFVQKNGKFIRGDLEIFVMDYNGYCLVYGNEYKLIWRNLINVKDDDGKAYIRLFINTVKNGPGQVSFRQKGAHKLAYVEPVKKDGKSYVVGTSYFT